MKKRYLVDYDYRINIAEFSYEKETEKNYIVSDNKTLKGWLWISSRVPKTRPSFENFPDALEYLKQLVLKKISKLEEEIEKSKKDLQEIEDVT